MLVKKDFPDHADLYQIAERQGGYFSARQAQQAGFTRPLLAHHAKTGKFFRVKHGIYRLAQFPESPFADLFVAALELHGRGVFSHETALALYELSDTLPIQLHLTVPPQTSRRHPDLKLHTSRLTRNEITNRHGLAVTTVPRTFADVIASGMAEEQVRLAVQQAIERGLVSKASLQQYANKRGGRMVRIITDFLSEQVER